MFRSVRLALASSRWGWRAIENALFTRRIRPEAARCLSWRERCFSSAMVDRCHSTGEWREGGERGGGCRGPAPLLAAAALLLCAHSSEEDVREFIVAAKDGNTRALKKYVRSGRDIANQRHPLGWTALHAAVLNQRLDAVKLLLESGADVNVKDEFSTASRVASRLRSSASRVAMIRDEEFSDKVNHHANYSGFTPLHYAVLLDSHTMAELLLENGADPTLENNRGLRPEEYCVEQGLKDLLHRYTAKVKEQRERELLEERRNFPLEDRLRQSIIGQEGPITAVASAIRRKEMGWADDEHPLVFLFLGSSGIGKTELAKQVASYTHRDRKEGFIRLDMSEYQEKHEVAKMIGSPPGYVGHDQGGQLTSRLRECPDAVVLFDEVEKAHPDVLTVLLQLFDEGRLTDGQGKTVECKNAIFVMTSNLASDVIASHGLQLRKEAEQAAEVYRRSDKGSESEIVISKEFKEQVVEPILKRHFLRDEFLGRINEMLYFLPFSRSELNLLVEKELQVWEQRARERHSIALSWDREVLDVLADGYNVKYGARSLQHEVERRVVNLLASSYEQEVIHKGSQVHLTVENSDTGPVIKLQLSPVEPGPTLAASLASSLGLISNHQQHSLLL